VPLAARKIADAVDPAWVRCSIVRRTRIGGSSC